MDKIFQLRFPVSIAGLRNENDQNFNKINKNRCHYFSKLSKPIFFNIKFIYFTRNDESFSATCVFCFRQKPLLFTIKCFGDKH